MQHGNATRHVASRTKNLFAGGYINNAIRCLICTFASTGNATDFGDLTQYEGFQWCMELMSTRVVMGGGGTTPHSLMVKLIMIDYITIAKQEMQLILVIYNWIMVCWICYVNHTRGIAGGGQTPDLTLIMNHGIHFIIRTTGKCN